MSKKLFCDVCGIPISDSYEPRTTEVKIDGKRFRLTVSIEKQAHYHKGHGKTGRSRRILYFTEANTCMVCHNKLAKKVFQ